VRELAVEIHPEVHHVLGLHLIACLPPAPRGVSA
jgi:hypothetical protein